MAEGKSNDSRDWERSADGGEAPLSAASSDKLRAPSRPLAAATPQLKAHRAPRTATAAAGRAAVSTASAKPACATGEGRRVSRGCKCSCLEPVLLVPILLA